MKRYYSGIIPSVIVLWLFVATNTLAQPSRAFEGLKLFNTSCFLCHGVDGKGQGPLSSKLDVTVGDLTDDASMSKRSDRELFRIIQGTAPHGVINKSMPQWGMAIPEPQIRSLIAYLRFLHRSKHPLIGDPELGQTVYQRRCSVCHGNNGKGGGPLTNVIEMEPIDHTDAAKMDKFTNERLRGMIVEGSADKTLMPGWEGLLSEHAIDSVISYIRLLSSH